MKKTILSLFALLLLTSCASTSHNFNAYTAPPVDNGQASSTHIFADGIPDRILFKPDVQLTITSPLMRVSYADNQWYYFTADNSSHSLFVTRSTLDQFKQSCEVPENSWTEKIGDTDVQFCKRFIKEHQIIIALASLKGQMIMFSGVDLSVENIRGILPGEK